MTRIERSIEIRAPPEKVWPMIFWDRIPEWMDTIMKGEYTSEKRGSVGSTFHVTGETSGIKAEFDVEITELVENEMGVWRTTGGNFTAFGKTTFKPTEVGTKLTMMMDYELPYSILGKIIDKFKVSKEMEEGIEKGLQKLKDMLET